MIWPDAVTAALLRRSDVGTVGLPRQTRLDPPALPWSCVFTPATPQRRPVFGTAALPRRTEVFAATLSRWLRRSVLRHATLPRRSVIVPSALQCRLVIIPVALPRRSAVVPLALPRRLNLVELPRPSIAARLIPFAAHAASGGKIVQAIVVVDLPGRLRPRRRRWWLRQSISARLTYRTFRRPAIEIGEFVESRRRSTFVPLIDNADVSRGATALGSTTFF
mmetsp:Transcript_110997/g.353671  ORF Transcript_110997/g.353671 Transcript_110997/m.353671 type:complete len:221 (+) Transcript_110997:1378-2040(+)